MENADKLVDRIKSENIKPRSKGYHRLGRIALGLILFLALLFGGFAFSVILLSVQQADFSIISHMSHSKLELFLGLVPIIWLILVILFLIPTMWSIRNSWKGYKFSLLSMLIIYLLACMALGTLFFITGGSERLEQSFDIYIADYESIEERKIQVWSRPESGYLSGVVLAAQDRVLQLEDFEGAIWQIFYPDAFVAPIVMLEPGETVKLIGKVQAQQRFVATEIRPWGGNQGRGGPGRQRMQK